MYYKNFKIYNCGSFIRNGIFNYIVLYINQSNLKWTKLIQEGQNQPGLRSGHTITTVGKQHILFGGLEGKQGKGE